MLFKYVSVHKYSYPGQGMLTHEVNSQTDTTESIPNDLM